jgi:hypothetical protein
LETSYRQLTYVKYCWKEKWRKAPKEREIEGDMFNKVSFVTPAYRALLGNQKKLEERLKELREGKT